MSKDTEQGLSSHVNLQSLLEEVRNTPFDSPERDLAWERLERYTDRLVGRTTRVGRHRFSPSVLWAAGSLALILAAGAVTYIYSHGRSSAADFPMPASVVEAASQQSSGLVLPLSYHQVEQYIQEFLQNDRLGSSEENAKREWKVFMTAQFAQMAVKTDMGIWIHDFLNKDPKSSRSVPTGGLGDGPTWKAWYAGHPIPGQYNIWAAEYNKADKRLLAVWAGRITSEGGWSETVHPQPHNEFWRVYVTDDPEKWFVSFRVYGQSVPGEELLTHTLPEPLFTSPKRF